MKYLPDVPENLDTETLKESRQYLIRVKAVLHGFPSPEAKAKRSEITEVIQLIDRVMARRGLEVGDGQVPGQQADALHAEEHVKDAASTCAPSRSQHKG